MLTQMLTVNKKFKRHRRVFLPLFAFGFFFFFILILAQHHARLVVFFKYLSTYAIYASLLTSCTIYNYARVSVRFIIQRVGVYIVTENRGGYWLRIILVDETISLVTARCFYKGVYWFKLPS